MKTIPRGLSRALWVAAFLALYAALVWFNRPDAAPVEAPAAQYVSDAALGHEPGQQLPPFEIEQTNGETFSLAEHRGQVVVINLWATWCTPCVKELPHFDALQKAHPEDVVVLAIHSDLITDDPIAYLSNFDYGFGFAIDEGGEVIASLGGSTMLPQTVVLDKYGVVTYNQVGSVTYEALEELVAAAGVE